MLVLASIWACRPPEAETESSPVVEPPTERPLAGGLAISKVKLYQGTETVLLGGGGDQPPIVIGRDAQLRVFVDLDDAFAVRDLTAILTVDDGAAAEVQEDTMRVEVDSKPGQFDTTFEFAIPGAAITPSTTLSLRIVEETPTGLGGGDPADVEWTSTALEVHAIDPLQIVILPIEYLGDGTGRLPDTSEDQVERIHDRVRGMYPASEVIVRVDPPYPWPSQVGPVDLYAWGTLLNQIVLERAYANEPANTYYYGLFSPADDLSEYCQVGCILGLSYVASEPSFAALRASIGVAFEGQTEGTLVHEVGHAHGRLHAPCGLYGQPSDPEYPHELASTGVWGWDAVDGAWIDPDETADVMSYCLPQWVSDYTWTALAERGIALSSTARGAGVRRSSFFVGPDGAVSPGPPVEGAPEPAADRRALSVFDATGAPRGVREGAFFPLDHGPGGIVVLDEVLPAGWTAR